MAILQSKRVALLCLGLVAGAAAGRDHVGAEENRAPRIRAVIIHAEDVYPHDAAEQNLFFRAVNALHWVSREDVIRRTVLLKEGDLLDPALVAETERNLRALGTVAEAELWTEPVGPGEVDLHVRTRDVFTLRVELSGSYLGGVAKGRIGIGESNLFGSGKSLRFSEVRREGKRLDRIQYFDPQLWGSKHTLLLRHAFGSTELNSENKGTESYEASFALPFYKLDCKWSYGAAGASDNGVVSFYEGDIDDTTDVEIETDFETAFVARRWGKRDAKHTVSTRVSHEEAAFGRISGLRANQIRVPPDHRMTSLLTGYEFDRVTSYEERERLDGIVGVEDLAIGWQGAIGLGVADRQEQRGLHTFPLLTDAAVSINASPTREHVFIFSANGSGRLSSEGEYRAFEFHTFGRHYYQGLPEQTWVLAFAYDAIFEGEGLQREFTLGEESGLRGYEARSFSGNKRLRLNIEDRIFTPIEVWSIAIGFVAFSDAGFVWPQGESVDLRDLRYSAEVGIRVGSLPLLRTRVLRFDLAFPLSSDERGSVTVSVSAGQVIKLFSSGETDDSDF